MRHDGAIVRSPVPERLIENAARDKMFEAGYDPDLAIAEAWQQVRLKTEVTETEHLLDDLTILLEPGRSIIADVGICLTSVRNVKERPLSDINTSMSHALEIKQIREKEKREKQGSHGVSFGIHDIKRSFFDPTITAEHWLLTDAGFNILLSMETYKWYYHLISAMRAGEDLVRLNVLGQ